MDSKKRTLIQAIAAIIQNSNFSGFFSGKIFTGATKGICVPGLNCYSCPGALGACPLGSLQNAVTATKFKFPFYVLGFILFFGIIFGRLICGFLCPFGFFQDLLNKIPLKKIKSHPLDKPLRYLKYVILVLFVFVFPFLNKLTPAFCKYICPSGTLSGLILSLRDQRLVSLFGEIFTIKLSILILIILICIKITRPFCKYICPLGALYGLFNRISVFRLSYDRDKCISCNACKNNCCMNINPCSNPNSPECIRCLKCVNVCEHGALKTSRHLTD